MNFFDSKVFNGEVFGKYVERIPNTKRQELVKSGVLNTRNDLKAMLVDQTGGNYITVPFKGLLDGTPVNYDGATDITSTSTKTYSQGMVVVGRAKGWTEKDFPYDITGVDFMDNVAQQVSEYWYDIDQGTLLSILKGIFSMADTAGASFVAKHTNDITGADTTINPDANKAGAVTLNKTIQKACGDNKQTFSLAIMDSEVATNLENLNVLEFLKYTDASGITRDLTIATWNGKIVLVDDGMPKEEIDATYEKTSDQTVVAGKTYYTRSGSSSAGYTYTLVAEPADGSIGSYYEMTAEGYTAYTTYILGRGAIEYCDCGAKVPYEMTRDAKTNGGEDTLYTRQRKLFAPKGISFTKASMASLSPTNAELETGANWELVNDGAVSNKTYINDKAIPIARLISRG